MKVKFTTSFHSIGFSLYFWNGKPYKSIHIRFLVFALDINFGGVYKKKVPTAHELKDIEWAKAHPSNEFSAWAVGDALHGLHSIRKQMQDALDWTYGLEIDVKRAYTTQRHLEKDLKERMGLEQ